jgi:hypothetical protein
VGLGGPLYKRRPSPVRAVATDLGICVAGIVIVAAVGSLFGDNGYGLYSVLVMTPCFLVAAIVVSIIIEVVARSLYLIWGAVVHFAIVGVLHWACMECGCTPSKVWADRAPAQWRCIQRTGWADVPD